MTRTNVVLLLGAAAVLCLLANRLTGLFQLYGTEAWEDPAVLLDSFVPTLLSFPVFTDRASVAASVLVLLGASLYFIAKFDLTGEYALKAAHRGSEYGSAHWATDKEMDRFKDHRDAYGNIILGRRACLSLAKIPDRLYERNKHIEVLGGSGAGKSYNFFLPNILQLFASYVVTDPKGELLERTGQFFLDHGYDLVIANTDRPDRSMGFNPFTMIKSEVDILRLGNCIIDNTQPPEGHKDFWVNAELLLYEFCIGYMWFFAPPESQNIDTLLRLVGMAQVEEENEAAVSAIDILVRELEERYGRHDNAYFLIELWRGFKKGAGKTLKSILVSCEVRLAPFKVPQVREMMRYDEIGDLSRLADGRGRKAAFFILLSAGDNTYRFLSAMIFFRLFDDLVKHAQACPGKTLPQRVVVCMDEAANIGRVPDMERHIAYLRSFGIDLIMALQSEAQLDEVYGKENAKVIKGNCGTELVLGGLDHETNKAVSEELGNQTIIVENRSYSKGGPQGGSYSVSEQRLGKPLMSADELGSDHFRFDQCIIKIKQAAPYLDDKYDPTAHPRFGELSEEPFDYGPYVVSQRLSGAKGRVVKRYAALGIAMPAQDYYEGVVEELMLMDAS